MVDTARTSDRDIEDWLAEIESLTAYVGEHFKAARARARLAIRDGYPARSMPESSVAGGRMSDPTADFVTSKAGGKMDENDPDMAVSDDEWREQGDVIQAKVSQMIRELEDGRNRIRGAAASLRGALPHDKIPDPVMDQCRICFVAKSTVTKHGEKPKLFINDRMLCASCSRREDRAEARRQESQVVDLRKRVG